MVTTVTRTGALEAARREWVKAEQEEPEVRRPFEKVSARLMDLRPALARAEAEVREQETLEGIEAARVQAEALRRELDEAQKKQADLLQVVQAAERRTRDAEKRFRDLEGRAAWLRQNAIPQAERAIAERRRLVAEAEAELARRRDAVAEGEQARARLREELAEIVGE